MYHAAHLCHHGIEITDMHRSWRKVCERPLEQDKQSTIHAQTLHENRHNSMKAVLLDHKLNSFHTKYIIPNVQNSLFTLKGLSCSIALRPSSLCQDPCLSMHTLETDLQ